MSTTKSTISTTVFNHVGVDNLTSLAICNKQFLGAERKVKRLLRHHGKKSIGLVIEGAAGTGKTHFANKLAEDLSSQAVQYSDYKTMPVLMVSAPLQSSVPNLVQALLHKLGDIKPSQGKEADKRLRLLDLLKRLEVKLIIVDEIHDYLPKKGASNKSSALSFLKVLMDETFIPMMFMGTERARLLNTMSQELGSRLRYTCIFSKVPYGTEEIDKFEFAEMASAFAENLPKPVKSLGFLQFIANAPKFHNVNLLDRLYVATDGLPRGLRDMFLEINIEMEDDPKFEPSLSKLAAIYSELACMNDFIDFNPFDGNRLDDVREYISTGLAAKGDMNEAA